MLTAVAPRGSVTSTGPRYEPGACNIGPAEIARRRAVGHAGLIATIAIIGVLMLTEAPPLLRLVAAVPAMFSASGYLQPRLRFCAAFGWRGVFNLGDGADTQAVADREARLADRRRAIQISVASLLIGLAAGGAAVLLPI